MQHVKVEVKNSKKNKKCDEDNVEEKKPRLSKEDKIKRINLGAKAKINLIEKSRNNHESELERIRVIKSYISKLNENMSYDTKKLGNVKEKIFIEKLKI